MLRSFLFSVLAGLALAGSAMAGDQSWLHVRIDNDDPDGDRVRINVPIEMVETVLPMIETKELGNGRIRIDDTELDGVELRKLWNAVKTAQDGEFISVENRRESVRVAKNKGALEIRIRDHDDDDDDDEESAERVDVQLPLEVVDAMLAGDEDELDLVAGLQALRAHGSAILVTGNHDGGEIRIWVDDKPEMD